MATAFSRKGSRVVGRLDEVEREVVVGLLEQTRDFLAPPSPAEPTGDAFEDLVATLEVPAEPAADRDPALDRLLPPGHRDDEGIASEYRWLTEQGLRQRKTANLETAISALRRATGDKVALGRQDATALLVSLTDVRLLLGERLGLRTDTDADALADRLQAAADRLDAAEEAGKAGDPGGPDDTTVDPRLHLAAYYDFLTWLQESLTHALMPR